MDNPNQNAITTNSNMLSHFVTSGMAGSMASSVIQNAKTQASSWFSLDTFSLRTYIRDVDDKRVMQRIAASFMAKPMNDVIDSPDLYGPLMIVLTYALVLIAQTVHFAKEAAQESVIGSALFFAILFWVGSSSLQTGLGYGFEFNITFTQALCFVGYATAPYVVAAVIVVVISSTALASVLNIVAGLLSGIALIRTVQLRQRSGDTSKKLIMSAAVMTMHIALPFIYGLTRV